MPRNTPSIVFWHLYRFSGRDLSHPVEEFLGEQSELCHFSPLLAYISADLIWAGLFCHHYVAANHVQDVVERLAKPIHHIHTSSPVTSILPDPNNRSKLEITTGDGTKSYGGFSHLIFACQANAIPSILSSYRAAVRGNARQQNTLDDALRCVKAFGYRTTVTVNHTDESLLPDNRNDWRELNLVDTVQSTVSPLEKSKLCRDSTCTMATQIISSCSARSIYQTTSPIIPPNPETIISISYLERAILTTESKRALQGLSTWEEHRWWQRYSKRKTRIGPLQGCGRMEDTLVPGIWFCGSYASAGIPLLEGCVVSAKDVVDQGIFVCEGVKYLERRW